MSHLAFVVPSTTPQLSQTQPGHLLRLAGAPANAKAWDVTRVQGTPVSMHLIFIRGEWNKWSWFITGMTWVHGKYFSMVDGIYKPTYDSGHHHVPMNIPIIIIQIGSSNWVIPVDQFSQLALLYGGVLKWENPQSSSMLIGFSIANHPFWGSPPFMETSLNNDYSETLKMLLGLLGDPPLQSAWPIPTSISKASHPSVHQFLPAVPYYWSSKKCNFIENQQVPPATGWQAPFFPH